MAQIQTLRHILGFDFRILEDSNLGNRTSELASFFIKQTSDNTLKGELGGSSRVEINDDGVIGSGKTHGEGKNLVLVCNRDPGFFNGISQALDIANPSLHGLF